jgi:hypothetical protein
MRAEWPNAPAAQQSFKSTVLPWCRAQWFAGHRLTIEIRLHEDALTDRQRAYYHGVILKQIAMQARPNGQSFPLDVWKEHFRAQHLGFKTVTTKNPLTGKKVRRRVRVSTEDLGVKRYSHLIECVTAFAVTELGVRFPCDFAQWDAMHVDTETGEILC